MTSLWRHSRLTYYDLGPNFLTQGVELLPGEVWQVSKRNSQYFRSYSRKTTGGGPFGPPPSGARVNMGPMGGSDVIPFKDKALQFWSISLLYPSLSLILYLKVGCSVFGPVRDRAVYPICSDSSRRTPKSPSTHSQGSCDWFKHDWWVKLEQILQLKVRCLNFSPVRDSAIYLTYPPSLPTYLPISYWYSVGCLVYSPPP